MIDTPQILETAAQPTAIIHVTVPSARIREVMGPGLRELMSTLAAQGVVPTGRWFTHHLKMPGDSFDFEIGVPVGKPLVPAGRVTNGELPAVTVARTVYHGPYEGLPQAWPELGAWIAAQGRTPAPSLWETYLTDPAANRDPTPGAAAPARSSGSAPATSSPPSPSAPAPRRCAATRGPPGEGARRARAA